MKNTQFLIGNLGRAAEVRHFDNNRSKASFSIATSKNYKNIDGQNVTNTQWHNIVAWDSKITSLAEQNFTTGKSVFIKGESTSRSYQNREGRTIYIKEVKATQAIPLDNIAQNGAESSHIQNMLLGRLTQSPKITIDENGESVSQLIFQLSEGTLPIEIRGRRAEVAGSYLKKGDLACVDFEIRSILPFKAVATELTLVNPRPQGSKTNSSNEEQSNNQYLNRSNSPSSNSEPNQSTPSLDDLPF